jgi:hypothetical protein
MHDDCGFSALFNPKKFALRPIFTNGRFLRTIPSGIFQKLGALRL